MWFHYTLKFPTQKCRSLRDYLGWRLYRVEWECCFYFWFVGLWLIIQVESADLCVNGAVLWLPKWIKIIIGTHSADCAADFDVASFNHSQHMFRTAHPLLHLCGSAVWQSSRSSTRSLDAQPNLFLIIPLNVYKSWMIDGNGHPTVRPCHWSAASRVPHEFRVIPPSSLDKCTTFDVFTLL